MADDQILTLEVQVHDPGRSAEQVELASLSLREDLAELGVDVDGAVYGPAPEGAKSAEFFTVGALLVTLVKTPELLRAVLGVIETWVAGRRTGSVEVRVGEDFIRLTEAGRQEQRDAMLAFVEHLANGDDDGRA